MSGGPREDFPDPNACRFEHYPFATFDGRRSSTGMYVIGGVCFLNRRRTSGDRRRKACAESANERVGRRAATFTSSPMTRC